MAPLPPDLAQLVAAGVLLLAFDEPGTISAEAHGIMHGVEHGVGEAIHHEHGKIIQLHVKTPAGEIFYHLPIGSLIVKHPGPVHHEHSRMLKAGEHAFAVPKHAKVLVPKDTDLSDEKEVNDAAKHVVLKSSEGEERHVHINPHSGNLHDAGKMTPFAQQQAHKDLEANWKELPEGKKPVAFNGKIGAWVPHEWQLHHPAGTTEGKITAKWAKDAEGKWHLIHKGGMVDDSALLQKNGDAYLKSGKLVPEHSVPEPSAAHVEPKPAQPETPAAGKINVYGAMASKDEIHQALQILEKDQSTAVKQPLAKAGHPLAGMDYHALNKDVLKAHPELKVEKGTKQAHVGQVKTSVKYHLAQLAGGFPQTKAEEHVAEETKQEVKEQAKHAQDLTPATHELGGVAASKEDIAAAIKHLTGTQSTQINQTLKAKGNPLGKSDYWSVVKGHQKAFPESTKGMKAKAVFVAALQHHLDQLGKEDAESGHEVDKAVHDLIDKGVPKDFGEHNGFSKAMQLALKSAHEDQKVRWVRKPPGQPWEMGVVKPSSAPPWNYTGFYRVAPDHSVQYFADDKSEGLPWDKEKLASAVSSLFAKPSAVVQSQTKQTLAQPKVPDLKPELPKPPEEPVKDFAKEPGWDLLHKTIADSAPISYAGPSHAFYHPLLAALQYSHQTQFSRYVIQNADGKYYLSSAKPDTGSFGAPGLHYMEVLPDHQVISVADDGTSLHWSIGAIDKVAKQLEPKAKPAVAQVKKELPGYEEPGEVKPAADTVPLIIKGNAVTQIPAGSKIFNSGVYQANPDTAPYKYAKYPDGSWHGFGASGKAFGPESDQTYENWINHGALVQEGAKPETETAAAKSIAEQPALKPPEPAPVKAPEPPPEPEPAEAPEGQVAVKVSGAQVGTVPEGSTIYYDKVTSYGVPQKPDTAGEKYALLPDGTWKKFGASGEKPIYAYAKSELPGKVVKGHLQEEGTETPEHLASVDKAIALVNDLKHGSVKGIEGYHPTAPDFETALAGALLKSSASAGAENYVYKDGTGSWKVYAYTYQPSSIKDFYKVSMKTGVPELTHTANGITTELGSQQLYDAAGKHVVPDSVLINGVPHKSGFYYNPKSTKTFLEINTSGTPGYFKGYANKGEASKAEYIWHKSDGTTEKISPVAAKKKLETNSEYHAQVKAGIEAGTSKLKAAKFATLAQPGAYKMWSSIEHGPSTKHEVVIKDDGTAVLFGGGTNAAVDEDGLGTTINSGMLLDQHGNTVVKPGVEPSTFHLFGSGGKSREELEAFLTSLQESHGSAPSAFKDAVTQHLPGWQSDATVKAGIKSFLAAKQGQVGAVAAVDQQRTAIEQLLHEMLQIPNGKPTDFLGKPEEPVYLKGLPPGLSKPEDVFTWAGNGMAQPAGPHVTDYSGGEYVHALSSATSPELADKIKAISEANGGGKVVGTHVASLSKDQRVAWLQAWRKGDMQAVFHLDASGGKVSPLHPGAPANAGTHQITWSPWNPSEVPSSAKIAGEWSDHNKVTLPKAEIANYVIKAGLEHPEHLSQAELRQWVKSHRMGNQDVVDHLSSMAHERWAQGQAKLTETPSWTDHLQAAKSYDIHVEEKKAASSWPEQAIADYVKDNWAKLKPFAGDTGAPEAGQYADYQTGHPLIQKYLDHEEAKWVSEQSKPVYSATPGAVQPVSSHPIYEITATVPLTGDTSQWYFKPSPPMQSGYSMKYRPDVSHAAAALARTWGFRTPESRLITHDGQYGAAQRKLAHLGDLVGGKQLGKTEAPKIPWDAYTAKQVQAVAKEHLLDWALDNADGRAANLLHTPDGDIVGIDKEHAYRNFGQWKGLASDEGADTFAKLAVTQLYNAVRNHQIGKGTADKAYVSVIHQARRMQQLPDQRMRAILETGLAERKNFGEHGSGTAGRASYIDAIIARKNGLEKDFQGVWGKVYKDAGWKLPEVPQNQLSHGLHSGFSEPTFFDHVMAAKSHGVPAFFASHDLERGNFLVWHEKAGDSHYIRGETRLSGDALKAVSDWASSHQTGGLVNPLPAVPAAPKIIQPKVNDELSWHNAVVSAAKAVSKHAGDQVYTGSWTSAKLAELQAAKGQMQTALATAEKAKQAGPDSKLDEYVKSGFGSHPEHVASAAQHYLNQVKQIEDAQATAGQFHKGDLPRWEGKPITIAPPKAGEPKPEISGVKVELRPSTRILTAAQETPGGDLAEDHIFDKDTGELHLGDGVYSYPGNAWHITLPTGEIIEINDEAKTQTTALAQVGRIRFRAVAANGSSSLENIRSHLQAMGVPLDEAQQHDMELLYWRHLGQQLSGRGDWNKGKHADVWDSLKQGMAAHKIDWNSAGRPARNIDALAKSGISPADELGIWHGAFSHITTPDQVKSFSEEHGYLPHLSHFDVHQPEVTGGKPIWYRFDADPHVIASQQMPQANFYNGAKDAVLVTRTGGMISTEGRLRALGIWKSGSSSTGDMTDHGSSGVVYTRLNQESSAKSVLFHPRVLARTDTYGFNHDAWGDVGKRATHAESFFNLKSALAHSNSSNETDLHDAASLLDDIQLIKAYSADQRAQIISELKSHGITHISGLPVEDRIVTSITPEALAKARSSFAADPLAMFAHPETPYVPPQAESISAEQSATETAHEIASAEEGGSKGEQAAGVLATHELGAPVPKINQMLYHQDSQPPASHGNPEVVKVKSDTAKRLAEHMSSSTEDMAALAKDAHLEVPPGWGPQRQATAGALVQVWAKTNTSPIAHAYQQVAHDLFGVQKPASVKLSPQDQAEVDKLIAQHGPVLQDFLKTQYALTQQDLQKAGITHVTVHRGFAWGKGSGPWGTPLFGKDKPEWAAAPVGSQVDTPATKPLSSFAANYDPHSGSYAEFTGHGGSHTIVKTTVPASLVFSYPRSGMGSYWQSEFIVLDSPGKWEIWKQG